jgi:hypothetical protein
MSLFKTASGVHVPNPWKLAEGYEALPKPDNRMSIRANISVEHLGPFFQAAVGCLTEPVFLILESPCNELREIELRKDAAISFHSDVYYSELGPPQKVVDTFERYEDLLINDGFIRFGAASQKTKHQVLVAYYKLVHLSGAIPLPFQKILDQFQIPKEEHLTTAWDLFTEEDPGRKSRYEADSGDIYDMLEALIRDGTVFFARTIEE